MSKILLDVTRLLTRLYDGFLPTGVDRVGLAYIERYGADACAVINRYGNTSILSEAASQQTFAMLIASNRDRVKIIKTFIRGQLSRYHGNQFSDAFLLHTSHSGMESKELYRRMKRQGVRSVFMIHDLIPLTHAEYCRAGVDGIHQRRIHTALRHADGLISNSQDTADKLANEASRAKLALPPSVVARLAPGVTLQTCSTRPLEPPYFLMLGTIEPRKNHWFMLHIWRRIVEILGERAPKLVIVGRRGWECENVIDMLERCSPLRDHVIERAHCSDTELHAWMQHAQALLFPSFVEGYGMPLVEALAMRLPVIASDLSVFHEIARDVPEYIDPLDGPGWIMQILNYADDRSPARRSQFDRMSDFQPPTWAEHFRRVDEFLESLANP